MSQQAVHYFTVKETSILLGFSTNSIYKFLDQGRLKSTRGSAKQGRFRISKKSIEDFQGFAITDAQLELARPSRKKKSVVRPTVTTETGEPLKPPIPLKITRMMILIALVFVIVDIFVSKDFSLFQQLIRLAMIGMITLVTYQYGELSHS